MELTHHKINVDDLAVLFNYPPYIIRKCGREHHIDFDFDNESNVYYDAIEMARFLRRELLPSFVQKNPDLMSAYRIARKLHITERRVENWCLYSYGQYKDKFGKTKYLYSFVDAKEYYDCLSLGRVHLSWERKRKRRE